MAWQIDPAHSQPQSVEAAHIRAGEALGIKLLRSPPWPQVYHRPGDGGCIQVSYVVFCRRDDIIMHLMAVEWMGIDREGPVTGGSSEMLEQQGETPNKLSVIDLRMEPVPWTPLRKPLSRCRVALVTTTGVHLQAQKPFDVEAKEGDPSWRELPSSTPLEEYRISHTHYDHSDADQDINCVFPISRVKEMVASGQLGSLADANYGFMGFIKDLEKLKENARAVARALLEQGVDVALGTPG